MSEICCECGNSVAAGSGRFVNRVPVLDSREERIENDRPFPDGEWVCGECEEKRDAERVEEESTTIMISKRDVATVLAALRIFQQGFDASTGVCEYEGMEHFDDYSPLDADEIDALCERINFSSLATVVIEVRSGTAHLVSKSEGVHVTITDHDAGSEEVWHADLAAEPAERPDACPISSACDVNEPCDDCPRRKERA